MTAGTGALAEVARELDRIVDRLTSLSLDRLPPIADDCRRAAVVLVAATRRLDPTMPPGARLPEVAPRALGWQLRVVGDDYLRQAARAPRGLECDAVRDALVELRRALP